MEGDQVQGVRLGVSVVRECEGGVDRESPLYKFGVMAMEKKRPAMILFGGDHGSWRKTVSLSAALNRSDDAVLVWNRGKETVFYLDREKVSHSGDKAPEPYRR
jgi:hypothetical protein